MFNWFKKEAKQEPNEEIVYPKVGDIYKDKTLFLVVKNLKFNKDFNVTDYFYCQIYYEYIYFRPEYSEKEDLYFALEFFNKNFKIANEEETLKCQEFIEDPEKWFKEDEEKRNKQKEDEIKKDIEENSKKIVNMKDSFFILESTSQSSLEASSNLAIKYGYIPCGVYREGKYKQCFYKKS